MRDCLALSLDQRQHHVTLQRLHLQAYQVVSPILAVLPSSFVGSQYNRQRSKPQSCKINQATDGVVALFGAVAVQTLQYANQLKQNDMADHAFTFGCQLFIKRSLYTSCSFGVVFDDQSHQNVCHAWRIQRGLLQNLARRVSFLQCCKPPQAVR